MPPDLVAVVEWLTLQRPAATTPFLNRRLSDAASSRRRLFPAIQRCVASSRVSGPALRTFVLHGETRLLRASVLCFRLTHDERRAHRAA